MKNILKKFLKWCIRLRPYWYIPIFSFKENLMTPIFNIQEKYDTKKFISTLPDDYKKGLKNLELKLLDFNKRNKTKFFIIHNGLELWVQSNFELKNFNEIIEIIKSCGFPDPKIYTTFGVTIGHYDNIKKTRKIKLNKIKNIVDI